MDTSRRVHDPLGSRASSCYSGSTSDHDIEMHQHGPGEEDWDEGDTFISFTTTETRCEQLFEEGLQYKTRGELDQAVPCFLKCLEGMQECQYFAKLPQTLHILAEIYQSLQCYDKAVEFASAEKLFYEAVLIDATQSQVRETKGAAGEKKPRGRRRPFSKKPKDQSWRRGSNPAEYGDLMIKKADEYHHLAKLCADQNKYELALDYCGKASKIRKSVFGDNHPLTVETLDYLTVLYAEVGRAEYAAALEKMNRVHQQTESEQIEQRGDLSHVEEGPLLTCVSDNCLNASLQLPPVKHTSAEVSSTATCSSTMEHAVDNRASDHMLLESSNSTSKSTSTSEGPIDNKAATCSEGEEATELINSQTPTLKENEQRPILNSEGCTETKQDVGSQLLKSSLSNGDCQSEHPIGEHSLKGHNQEKRGIQENKSDLSNTSKDVQSSHTCILDERSKMELANDPLYNTSTQHTNKESFDEAVNGSNKLSTAAITDVLSKAPACVYVPVPEQGIQHARCLPLWVLLLGAFVEMAILAYVFVTHR